MPETTPIHLVIPTHTTRHLELCLVSMARQRVPPETMTVTCDLDDPAIGELVQSCADRYGLKICYVCRATHGTERLAQVRNNAVRSLLERGHENGRLLFLDGDTYALEDCIEKHATLGKDVDLVLPYRIYLDESQTASLDAGRLFRGEMHIEPTADQLAALARVDRRARLHQMLKKAGLTKAHKPRMLGGHHSVSFDMYVRVNGHDEEYHTWGTEDDDFARRVYQAGGTARVAVNEIPVFHLYHPTRAPGDWHDRPNARRFARRDLPIICEHGLKTPLSQHPVQVQTFKAGICA